MSLWEVMQVVALIYIIFVIPVRIGFDVEVPLLSFRFWLDVAFDLYFFVDIWVCFNTAVCLPSGVLEVNPKKIRRRYLR